MSIYARTAHGKPATAPTPDRRLSVPELFLPTQETRILRKTGQVSKYFFSGRFDLESAGQGTSVYVRVPAPFEDSE
jgi:hypothetical protein